MQKAAVGKSYWSDAKLKESKLYNESFHHGRDAARHLLHWLTFGYGYQFTKDPPSLELVDVTWIEDQVIK